MLGRGRGNSKAKAQELSKKSIVVGGLAVLIVTSGLLLIFNAQPVRGDGAEVTTVSPYQAIKRQRKKTQKFMRKADYWAHKRGKHVSRAHKRLNWKPLHLEKKRTNYWHRKAIQQYKAFVRYRQKQKARRGKCRNAGFPRWYCPALVKAAKHEKSLHWAWDPNLAWIIGHESGFRPYAQNPRSTAYGLFQFLNSTWKGTGIAKTSDPYWQTRAGIRYIKGRYRTPTGAINHWKRNKWY